MCTFKKYRISFKGGQRAPPLKMTNYIDDSTLYMCQNEHWCIKYVCPFISIIIILPPLLNTFKETLKVKYMFANDLVFCVIVKLC